MTRRGLLGTVSTAVAALAGCGGLGAEQSDTETPTQLPTTTGDPEPSPTPTASPLGGWASEFDAVVDAVEDLGCDPTGEASCDAALTEVPGDDVLVTFPEGTYQFDGGHRFEGFERLGFLGTGEATLRPPEGFNDKLCSFLCDWVLFSGIVIDVSARETTAGLRFITDAGFHIEDVEFSGRGLHPDGAVVNAFALAVQNESDRGLVREVTARKGSAIGHYKGGNGRVGIWIGDRHRGHIDVEDCHLEEFGNNGIYGSRCEGTVAVTGGLFRNNNVCGVRLGGGDNVLSDARIEVDLGRYAGPYTLTNSDYDTRAVVVEQGPKDLGGRVHIEDCTLRVHNADRSQGVVVVWPTGNGPRIEGCTIENDVEWVSGIQGNAPRSKVGADERALRVRDTDLTGTADWGSAVEIVGRPGTRIEGTAIEERGVRRDGLRLVESNPCALDGTTINTSGYPIFAVNPRRSGAECLVTLSGDTDITRTGPDVEAVRSTEIPEEQSAGRRCVGSEIIAAVESYEGVGITALDGDTVFWKPYATVESTPDR